MNEPTTAKWTAEAFLRDRIDKGLPLYQGDVDSALAEARQPLLQEIGDLHRVIAIEREAAARAAGIDPEILRWVFDRLGVSSYLPPMLPGSKLAPAFAIVREYDDLRRAAEKEAEHD